jgi:chromosome segregation protein
MFLKSIKLAGFKSFVDPTVISIKSRLNAIVGPNGCGKSNVVDAVRWVVGEMSAKQLRGQSMSDVIFNGTKNRAPLGRASIELLFDNQSGRLGGAYAAYDEFSIRREMTRDGSSDYFINGTLCRRRDIVDIFFGTGLGSHRYAIIEQGMIARLVEAKPDELRVYLEEAAGISRYKDRRRETETRMWQTQDNLNRLHDLLDELSKQKRHLKRQANAAERYKRFKKTERLLKAQLKSLQWQHLHDQRQQTEKELKTAQTLQEQHTASQRELEKNVEKERLQLSDAQHIVDEAQQKFYQMNTEIARLEEQIHHSQVQKQQWTEELHQTEAFKKVLCEQRQSQQDKLHALTAQKAASVPLLKQAKATAEQAQQLLTQHENNMQAHDAKIDDFNQILQNVLRKKDITEASIQHYRDRIIQLEKLMEGLNDQGHDENIDTLKKEESSLLVALNESEMHLTKITDQLADLKFRIQKIKNEKIQLQQSRQTLQKTLYDSKRQLAVLEGLQAAAFGQNNEKLKQWLNEHRLMEHRRLAQCIQVDAGWEKAAQTVLQNFFDALCVPSIDILDGVLRQFPEGRFGFIGKDADAYGETAAGETLHTKIHSNGLIDSMLQHVFIADTLNQAHRMRSQLKRGQSVVTKDGVWLGRNWIRLFKTDEAKDNVLSREKRLKILSHDVSQMEESIEQQNEASAVLDDRLLVLENETDTLQALYQKEHIRTADLKTKLNAQHFKLSELQRQKTRLLTDKANCQQELSALQIKVRDKGVQIEVWIKELQQHEIHRRELARDKYRHQEELSLSREESVSAYRQLDELSVRLDAYDSELSLLTQSTAQLEEQTAHLTRKQLDLEQRLSMSDTPLDDIQSALDQALNQRMALESHLREVRDQYESHQSKLSGLTAQLQHVVSALSNAQSDIQEIQLTLQRTALEQDHLTEQVQALHYQMPTVLQDLPQDVNSHALTAQIEKTQQSITRLGAINLVAIHEYETVTKRCDYLEKQQDDLLKSLELLKEAIRKVDKETKERFKQTFDQVNENFSHLFPRIFEGGHASLELTDDDLLKSGVWVKAQPPGKRNTSIHLLSGGEKTLTAIGLIFALFEMNPSPFCILDEVDAPLDDINVNRFCTLLKEMSSKTQFLVITHNKVTMEMADVLMGVTMQEAGVSRVVSVMMEDAIQYAQMTDAEIQPI